MTAVQVENFRLAAALEYAALGWRVLPLHWPRPGPPGVRCSCGSADCKSVGKHPLTARGVLEASADPAAARAWWGRWPAANVGVATGAGSGIVVLDVDPRAGGDATLAALRDRHAPGWPAATAEAATGGGGSHVVFAHPGRRVANSAEKVGPGLDVRGDGGYVVAPPSLHASGGRYDWLSLCHPAECEPAALPAWLLAAMTDPAVSPPRGNARPAGRPRCARDGGDAAGHWLGRALMRAAEGNRNDTGMWLAAQLRDAGVPDAGAERTMLEFAGRAPAGGSAYTDREALATCRSVYARPPRDPARPQSYAARVVKAESPATPARPPGAAAELAEHLEDFIAGRSYDVGWPWPQLTTLTQALLPGSMTVVCGDPGVGKTFWVLQCLLDWIANGHEAAVFFVEKDRKFHTRRLLAQLESDGRYVDFGWVRDHPAEARAAVRRHAGLIDLVGRHIYSAPAELVTLDGVLGWVRQSCSAGKRVLVVDPITAAVAGVERWTKDDEFVAACGRILTAHGSSLVLVTHPKQGASRWYGGKTSGHGMAAGAAYFRFSDTVVWVNRTAKPRNVRVQGQHGIASARLSLFAVLHKTRDGKGAGLEVAFGFGEGLRFAEQGVVLADEPDGGGVDE